MAGAAARLIERFERLITEGDGLEAADVNSWVERAPLAVAAVYGHESSQLQRLDNISYSLGIWTDSTPRSAFAAAKLQGAREAAAMLTAIVEDLREAQADVPAEAEPRPADRKKTRL